jgi:hypothetical protein
MAKQLLSKRRSLVAHILRLRNGFWRELVEKNPGNGNRTRLEESSLGPANLVPHSAVQIFANLRRWGLDRRAENLVAIVVFQKGTGWERLMTHISAGSLRSVPMSGFD